MILHKCQEYIAMLEQHFLYLPIKYNCRDCLMYFNVTFGFICSTCELRDGQSSGR